MIASKSILIRRARVAIVALAVLAAPWAGAQDDLVLLINPDPNDFTLLKDAYVRYYDEADLEDEPGDLELTRYKLRLRYSLARNETREWFAGVDFGYFDLDTRGRLDQSLRGIPQDLYDLSVGLGYRRFLSEEKLAGGYFEVGSASDTLFDTGDEVFVRGTAFLRVQPNRIPWVFFLHVDTNLDYPVIPGVGLLFQTAGERVKGAIGIPMLAVLAEPTDSLDLQLSYVPRNNVHAEATYQATERLSTFCRFDWESTYFTRAERRDEDDRLEFEEKRAEAGLGFVFPKGIQGELSGGYAFDRSFGEGADEAERDRNDLAIEDGWFGALTFHVKW